MNHGFTGSRNLGELCFYMNHERIESKPVNQKISVPNLGKNSSPKSGSSIFFHGLFFMIMTNFNKTLVNQNYVN